MKTQTLLLIPTLAAMLGTLSVQTMAEPAKPGATDTKPGKTLDTVTGVLKEKSATTLLLTLAEGKGDAKVVLNDAVLITVNDQPATLEDLKVGSQLEVSVKKGTMEATAIKILDKVAKPKV